MKRVFLLEKTFDRYLLLGLSSFFSQSSQAFWKIWRKATKDSYREENQILKMVQKIYMAKREISRWPSKINRKIYLSFSSSQNLTFCSGWNSWLGWASITVYKTEEELPFPHDHHRSFENGFSNTGKLYIFGRGIHRRFKFYLDIWKIFQFRDFVSNFREMARKGPRMAFRKNSKVLSLRSLCPIEPQYFSD